MKQPEFQSIFLFFKLFMALFYISAGIYFMVYTEKFPGLSKETITILGITLMIYGIFRGYRTYIVDIKKNHE